MNKNNTIVIKFKTYKVSNYPFITTNRKIRKNWDNRSKTLIPKKETVTFVAVVWKLKF